MEKVRNSERADAVRPTCPTCDIPMWLARIDRVPERRTRERLYFKCTVCFAEEIVEPKD